MKNVQNKLGFGNNYDILPVFKSGGMHGAKLQRFQPVKKTVLRTTKQKYM